MSRKVYPISLRREGLEVLMAELTPSELVNAMKMAGNDPVTLVRGRKISHEAVKMSVREVNGTAVTYDDLDGPGWRKHFPRTRHSTALSVAWAQIHMPTADEVEKVEASMDVELDGESERWTITLPGGRRIVMVEQDEGTVDDALRAAETASKSASARAFMENIEKARRAIRVIDGEPVNEDALAGSKWDARFSARETYLLGHAFSVIHDGGEDLVVGEAKPISGTA